MSIVDELPATGFVRPQWAMTRYDISHSTLYLWVSEGRLPPLYRIGPRAVRFRAEDLREFEERLQVTVVAAR